jgi:hypothetical protein
VRSTRHKSAISLGEGNNGGTQRAAKESTEVKGGNGGGDDGSKSYRVAMATKKRKLQKS